MNSAKPLILVVDDDRGILEALRLLFESEGYRVQTSDQGDYVNMLPNAPGGTPDLIVLDVLLSGWDGRALCQMLKSQESTRRIPVVMLSAHPSARESVREVGADAFVAKPFAIDDLLQVVEGLLTATSGPEGT